METDDPRQKLARLLAAGSVDVDVLVQFRTNLSDGVDETRDRIRSEDGCPIDVRDQPTQCEQPIASASTV
jgi:hypothetical protein